MVKIEFSGWKALLRVVEVLFWIPVWLIIYSYIEAWKLKINPDQEGDWFLIFIIALLFWAWVSFGFKIRKAIEEWKE